ncbi:MAG: response regulator transcription factor [Verrucomicrobiota bacterium]
MRLLIVEDERKIASFIRKGLAEQGLYGELCHHGDDALTLLKRETYDAVILDIMLPGRDGLSILRALREANNPVPVLLLSARGEITERVEGLNLGADDYLPKPFAMDELIARLRSLLRRAAGTSLTCYRLGDLTLSLTTRKVTRGTREIELTAREFALLEYLIRSPGHVFTRTQICERVWDYHFDPLTNLVDVYIQRLRKKIDEGEAVRLIHTVRGIGYSARLP